MNYEIRSQGKFKYVEEGQGEPLVLLHGLFGALSNFQDLIEHFKSSHRVIIPLLPLTGAAINGLLGKRFSRQAVSAVALTFCVAAFGWALFVVSKFPGLDLPHVESLAPWLRASQMELVA